MLLNLSQLRRDFKAVYKHNWPLGNKLNILIEITKLKQDTLSDFTQGGKRIKLSEILVKAGISMRTSQRWEQLYRQHGINGIIPKKKGHPEKKEIPIFIARLITYYRKRYRWGE